MTTSAIVPVTGVDFDSSSATASQQTVFNNLLNQLQQSVGSGDLTTSATLLNAIEALSPSAAGGSNPLGAFLTSLGTALNDGSVSEAQSALATYQNATPASAASTTAPDASTSASAANIAAGLIQSQIQLNLVTTLLNPASSSSNSSNSSANGSVNSLLSILTAAYPDSSGSSTSTASSASSSSASGTSSSTSATPYDTLVSSIQASLDGGDGTLTPALAYLQASGNFVNTSA